MKKVLLTGGTGFIGQHCPPLLLSQGYEVHATYSNAAGVQHSGLSWHQVDLLDCGQIAQLMAKIRPSHLLHFAWYAEPNQYWTSSQNFHWVQASLALLEEFANQGGQRVVMAGTCAEYNWQYGYCSENVTPLAPSSLYGTCKHSLQAMLAAYSHQFNLSSAWGRIFFLYGPYEHPTRLVASVIGALLQEKPARCTHGEQIRDFLYVCDVAEAFVKLLDSPVAGAVNIASGNPIRVKTVIKKIAELLNRLDLVQWGAVPLSEREPPLLVADVKRLTEEVAWKPAARLENQLEKTIRYWQTKATLPL